MKRRAFVQNSMMAAAAVSMLPTTNKKANADKKARLAFIGVGLRGQNHLDNALRRSDVEVVAICDINENMLTMAGNVVKKSGKPMPQIFKGDPYAYRKLLELKNIDGVIIATPWEWHCPMIIDSTAGRYKICWYRSYAGHYTG